MFCLHNKLYYQTYSQYCCEVIPTERADEPNANPKLVNPCGCGL